MSWCGRVARQLYIGAPDDAMRSSYEAAQAEGKRSPDHEKAFFSSPFDREASQSPPRLPRHSPGFGLDSLRRSRWVSVPRDPGWTRAVTQALCRRGERWLRNTVPMRGCQDGAQNSYEISDRVTSPFLSKRGPVEQKST